MKRPSEEHKVQLEAELKQSQKDCSSIKTAMSEATALREKQAGAFASQNAHSDANISMINAAVTAMQKGTAHCEGNRLLRFQVKMQSPTQTLQ